MADAKLMVWIDQDLCTGDGLCEEIAPDVFTLLDDGLAYVKEGDKIFSDPGGPEGAAPLTSGRENEPPGGEGSDPSSTSSRGPRITSVPAHVQGIMSNRRVRFRVQP